MRSLFVDDIYGARPRHRYFQKILYREKHQNQIDRFGPQGRDYKKSYDWYNPTQRHVEPIERQDFPVKLFNYKHAPQKHHNPEELSQSLVMIRRDKQKIAGKVTELSPQITKSTILSGSGQQSLSTSLSESHQNPYFPHMYVDSKMGQKNKWKGTRHWDQEHRKLIRIPREDEIVAKSFGR